MEFSYLLLSYHSLCLGRQWEELNTQIDGKAITDVACAAKE